jgi:hypothetical protein
MPRKAPMLRMRRPIVAGTTRLPIIHVLAPAITGPRSSDCRMVEGRALLLYDHRGDAT